MCMEFRVHTGTISSNRTNTNPEHGARPMVSTAIEIHLNYYDEYMAGFLGMSNCKTDVWKVHTKSKPYSKVRLEVKGNMRRVHDVEITLL